MSENGNGHFEPEDDNLPVPRIEGLPEKADKRCLVCNSEYRKAIDRLVIMPHVGFTDIEEMFGVPRRSVSRHVKKHLNYEEAAIRRLIEHEAQQLQVDAEEGVKGALGRRVFLNAYIQRTTEALLNGDLELTGKDAMNAIQMLDQIDSKVGGVAIDEMRMQFSAFTQAMREICTPDQWHQIVSRTKELLEGETPQLNK